MIRSQCRKAAVPNDRRTAILLSRALFFLLLLMLMAINARSQNWLKKKKSVKPKLIIAGSVSCKQAFPIATVHHFAVKRKWDVCVYGSGSENAIEAVAAGAADLAISTRPLTEEEKHKGLRDSLLAYDAIAVIVHESNPVEKITLKQLQKILRRKIKNWKKLGGPDAPIHVVLPDTSSGMRRVFLERVLEKHRMKVEPVEGLSTYGAVALVQKDSLAIGICSMSQAKFPYIKALSVNGAEANRATLADGSYPLRVPVLLITRGQPSDRAQTFLAFMKQSRIHQMLSELFYVPLNERPHYAE